MKKGNVLLIFLSLFTKSLICQVLYPFVVATSGGSSLSSSCLLTYTVGEPIFETGQNQFGILTQGFNQIYILVNDIPEKINDDFIIEVFPNPTSQYLNISVKTSQKIDLEVFLYDMNGKEFERKILRTSNSRIDLTKYSNSMFLIKIMDQKKIVKTYKIQKI